MAETETLRAETRDETETLSPETETRAETLGPETETRLCHVSRPRRPRPRAQPWVPPFL